jgi:AcrR family transcriptional regulator
MLGKDTTLSILKREERKTRQQIIIKAAERVYGKKPFETVSMRDIAKEAGISVSTIYRYFPDQQTLFVEAFVSGTQELIARMDDRIGRGEITNLADLGLLFINFLIENDHYFCMMTHFMLDGSLSEKPLEKLNTAARSILDQFERVFGQCGDQRTPRFLAHAYFAALNGILISFRNYPGRSASEVRHHMEELSRTVAQALDGYSRQTQMP